MDLVPNFPSAGTVDLPGRGRTWVYDTGTTDTRTANTGTDTGGEADTGGSDTGCEGAPTLLLLHGWTSSAALNWWRCFDPLAKRYRVVALDHRGHGRGVRSRKRFAIEDCADDAAALVRELDLGRVIPVGYSMGGPVALHLWHRHPELVQGLVLCATAGTFGAIPRWSGRRGDVMLAISVALGFTPELLKRRAMRYIASRWAEPGTARWAAEEWARHDPTALMQCGMALSRYDATSWLGEIDVPTSVVLTEEDTTVPPRRQQALASAIPGAVTFPVAAAHRACDDSPKKFVPALLAAVASVAEREGAGDVSVDAGESGL